MATAPKQAPKVVPIDESAAAPAAAPKKSKKKLILFSLIFLFLIGAGGGGWYYMSGEPDPDAPRKPDPIRPPVYLAMDPFTVNLQPEIGEQYLQVHLTLQVADAAAGDQVKLYMPVVRSRMLMLLSSKRPSEINTAEGKEKLQLEIVERLREPFVPNGQPANVQGVFFTSFVIQ